MTNLLISLMDSNTESEVDKIVSENLEKIDDSFNQAWFLCSANQAKRRIRRIASEKAKSFKVFELN